MVWRCLLAVRELWHGVVVLRRPLAVRSGLVQQYSVAELRRLIGVCSGFFQLECLSQPQVFSVAVVQRLLRVRSGLLQHLSLVWVRCLRLMLSIGGGIQSRGVIAPDVFICCGAHSGRSTMAHTTTKCRERE